MSRLETGIPNTKPTNSLAIGSFLSGLLWFGGLGSVVAVVLGKRALEEMKLTGQPGEGLARAGITLGWIGIVVTALGIFLALTSFATMFGAKTSSELQPVEIGAAALNVDSALRDVADDQAAYFEKHGTYRGSDPVATWTGVTLHVARADAEGYCIEAEHRRLARVRHITESMKRPKPDRC